MTATDAKLYHLLYSICSSDLVNSLMNFFRHFGAILSFCYRRYRTHLFDACISVFDIQSLASPTYLWFTSQVNSIVAHHVQNVNRKFTPEVNLLEGQLSVGKVKTLKNDVMCYEYAGLYIQFKILGNEVIRMTPINIKGLSLEAFQINKMPRLS